MQYLINMRFFIFYGIERLTKQKEEFYNCGRTARQKIPTILEDRNTDTFAA